MIEESERKKYDGVFEACLLRYGKDSQVDVCIEEMAELAKALLKHRRGRGTIGLEGMKAFRDSIIDELADVEIMCRQMELLFKAEAEVEGRIAYKVRRQKDRLWQAGYADIDEMEAKETEEIGLQDVW